VFTPSGAQIYFAEKVADGGELDVDRNIQGETNRPVENVRWTTGTAATGQYQIMVRLYKYHESSSRPIPFKVEVVNNGQVEHIEHQFPANSKGEVIQIGSFQFSGANANTSSRSGGFQASSVNESNVLSSLYSGRGNFFTKDISAFQRALRGVSVEGNESPLVALDTATDLPWRDSQGSNRIVIMLTDEPVEGGNRLEQSTDKISELMEKLQEQGIMLFLVSPDSDLFAELECVDRCVWHQSDGASGLRDIDFDEVLQAIAKSISVSQMQQVKSRLPDRRALFGQNTW
jgi:hypothetical protein